MDRTLQIENIKLYRCIKLFSNPKNFRIIEITQNKESSITEIAKKVNLAYNKCSDYCSKLEKAGLIDKRKTGKEVLVKPKVNLVNLSKILNAL